MNNQMLKLRKASKELVAYLKVHPNDKVIVRKGLLIFPREVDFIRSLSESLEENLRVIQKNS